MSDEKTDDVAVPEPVVAEHSSPKDEPEKEKKADVPDTSSDKKRIEELEKKLAELTAKKRRSEKFRKLKSEQMKAYHRRKRELEDGAKAKVAPSKPIPPTPRSARYQMYSHEPVIRFH